MENCVCCRLVFFKRWFEILDLVVVALSSFLTVLFILLEDHSTDSSGRVVLS